MKKQYLKQELKTCEDQNIMMIWMLRGLAQELSDTQEALDRRRILYDRLANHSTTKEPKSMNDMAGALYDMCWLVGIGMPTFQELPDAEKDKWMDRLLTILN